MWQVKSSGDGTELICGFVPLCQFCGVTMEPWNVKKLNFDIVYGSGDKLGHAADVEATCPLCGLECVFGVALSVKEYGEMNSMELVN